jgi:hypothetical protein
MIDCGTKIGRLRDSIPAFLRGGARLFDADPLGFYGYRFGVEQAKFLA